MTLLDPNRLCVYLHGDTITQQRDCMSTSTPKANIAPSITWALLSPFGRLGREPYWLCFILMWLFLSIALKLWLSSLPELTPADFESTMAAMETAPVFPVLYLVLLWIQLALVIKRLHDIGQNGFFALLVFVPFVNVMQVIFLGIVPSKPEPNRHGPLPNSYWLNT